MIIRQAEVDGRVCDVRVSGGRIAAIVPKLAAAPGEVVIEANGGALLPGLHDHHIHLNATAAAMASVACGPPQAPDAEALIVALRAAPGEGWLRGVGYHASVAGEIDRAWLDRHGPDRPIRIQHRSGRMWILNSRALEALGETAADGRLIDADARVGARLATTPPDLAPLGARLAGLGVTGLTEVTPRNNREDFDRLAAADLPQSLLVMGGQSLDDAPSVGKVRRGAVKLHYHDHDLPSLEALTQEVRRAHDAGRPVAAHCVTVAELFLTLAAIEEAGTNGSDRIEHAGLAPPEAVQWMAGLGVTVVTQPHFIVERGAAYLEEIALDERPWLYRLRGLRQAGVRLAGGSDAPFGSLSPWAAMAAATDRPEAFNAQERLTPEEALALFTGSPDDPGGGSRRVAMGEAADLCLIDRPWSQARVELGQVQVRVTLALGRVIHRAADHQWRARPTW